MLGDLGARAEEIPGSEIVSTAATAYAARYDREYGGLKQAPKFPSHLPARMMLRAAEGAGEFAFVEMAAHTLHAMAAGGMYDQLGGGFHRYSTDRQWLVPHFEKMLYDNALLVPAYLEAYQATGDQALADIAVDILTYLDREMSDPGGGFYSATDADSENPEGKMEEGWFFTWTPAELSEAVGEEAAQTDRRGVRSHRGMATSRVVRSCTWNSVPGRSMKTPSCARSCWESGPAVPPRCSTTKP